MRFLAAAAVALLSLAASAQQVPVKIVEVKGKDFPKLQGVSASYEIEADCDTKTLQAVAATLEDLRARFAQEFRNRISAEALKSVLQVRFYKTQQAMMANMRGPGGGPGGPGGPPGGGPGGGGPGGYYDPGTRTLHACLEQPAGDDWQFVLRHESTHQLLHNLLSIGGGQPGISSSLWFNEGFASYWAMTRWKGRAVSEDDVPAKLLEEFKRSNDAKTLMPLKELIGGRPDPSAMRAYYAQGWALCRFLRHHAQHRKQFAAWLDRERDGKITWDDFVEVFGIKDAAAFESDLIRATISLK
ncbi:MAG: DUF1570 domain-containing protein [Candidatus Brocadiae bacterium]|nr:DUF1570 domain-containing protein [Candidatus Brocadiia bacterium]